MGRIYSGFRVTAEKVQSLILGPWFGAAAEVPVAGETGRELLTFRHSAALASGSVADELSAPFATCSPATLCGTAPSQPRR